MERSPQVSIGLPVYNGAVELRRALDALLAQTFTDFELIISDNASRDDTYKICEEYAKRDGRIRLFRNERNIEGLRNFQRVSELAVGRYFLWAAADDSWDPEFIQILLKALEDHPEAGVAMSAFNCFRDDGSVSKTVSFRGLANPNWMPSSILMFAVATPLKYNLFQYGLFRSEILKACLKTFFDVPAWDRVFMFQVAGACRWHYVDKFIYYRWVHDQNYYDRYPDELISRLAKRKFYLRAKIASAIVRTLVESCAVPWWRKILIPPLILFYFLVDVGARLKRLAGKFKRFLLKRKRDKDF